MEYKDRLKAARRYAKLTQAELAKAAGITQTSISDLERGKSVSTSRNASIAKACGVSALWLEREEGTMVLGLVDPSVIEGEFERIDTLESNVIAYHPDDPLPEDTVLIPESLVTFEGGDGKFVANYELDETKEAATYKLSWFQREGINHKNCKRFRVTGSSMEPLLYPGDSVLVDLSENSLDRIKQGRVYAIRYGEQLKIKRLFRHLDGTLTLKSDNPANPDEDVPPSVAEEHITIIGRVRDKSGSGGL